MINENTITQIKAAANITDIIGKFVKLKRNGSSLVGLCPFHNEKSGSFHVHEKEGYYKCFGCGAGGDVLSLIHI